MKFLCIITLSVFALVFSIPYIQQTIVAHAKSENAAILSEGKVQGLATGLTGNAGWVGSRWGMSSRFGTLGQLGNVSKFGKMGQLGNVSRFGQMSRWGTAE